MNKFLTFRNKLNLLTNTFSISRNNLIKAMGKGFLGGCFARESRGTGLYSYYFNITHSRKSFCSNTEIKKPLDEILELNKKGLELMKEERFVEALQIYKQILVIDVNSYLAYNNMGIINKQLGNTNEAIENFKQVIEIKSEISEGYYNLGLLYQNQERYDESVVIFQLGIEKVISQKQKIPLYCILGVSYSYMNLHEKTLDCFEKAVVLGPESYEFWSDYGSALVNLGKYKEAIDKYDKSIEINPNIAESMSNKGIALLKLGEAKEAISTFEKAYSINPKSVDVNICLGEVYFITKNYQKSIQFYRNVAYKIKPNERMVWARLGDVLYKAEMYNEAIDSYINHGLLYPQDKEVVDKKIDLCKKERSK